MINWDGVNRRRFPRVNYPCLITIRHEENSPEVILTHTENIGIGGVCVIINRAISLFSPVDIELDLMDTGAHIRCKGKIVWLIRRKAEEKKKPLFYDLGIEFHHMNEGEGRRLDEIVRRLVKLGEETPYNR